MDRQLLETWLQNRYIRTCKVRNTCKMCKHRFTTQHKVEYCPACKMKSRNTPIKI